MSAIDFGGVYDWLMPDPDDAVDPVLVVGKLRKSVESMPPTLGNFRLGTLDNISSEHEAAFVTDRMMALVGSWQVPEYRRQRGKQKARRWVNPDYAHAHHYADAWTRCECGALMTRHDNTSYETPSEFHQDHADHCKTSWRFRARAEIMEERESIAREIAGLEKSVGESAARFGIEPTSAHNLHRRLAQAQHLDIDAMRDGARKKRLNTECALLASGYSIDEVRRIWGVGRSWMVARVRRSPWTMEQLEEAAAPAAGPATDSGVRA